MSEGELREGLLELIKVIDKAIMMEHSAQIFYSNVALNTDAPEGKKMYEWLANFEANHEEKLRLKREEVLSHHVMEGVTPPKLDDDSLLSEAGKSHDLPPEPSDSDILLVAIENEQRAYAYYNRKFTHTGQEHLKIMFETMAAEENKHIKILSDMRRHLQIEGIWGDFEAFEE